MLLHVRRQFKQTREDADYSPRPLTASFHPPSEEGRTRGTTAFHTRALHELIMFYSSAGHTIMKIRQVPR